MRLPVRNAKCWLLFRCLAARCQLRAARGLRLTCARKLPPGGSYRSTCDTTSAHFLSVLLRSVHGQTAPTQGRVLSVAVHQTEQHRPPLTNLPTSAASPALLSGENASPEVAPWMVKSLESERSRHDRLPMERG